MCRWWNIAQRVDVGSACVDRGQSPLTYLFKLHHGILLASRVIVARLKSEEWVVWCCGSNTARWGTVAGSAGEEIVLRASSDMWCWRIVWRTGCLYCLYLSLCYLVHIV